jgi:hypothetical protein
MPTERDKIVDELIRRIKFSFGQDSRIYAGDGGIWGAWGRELPCFHYYEQADTRKLIGNGLYDIILPIQLEYFVKLTRKAGVFEEGREKLQQVQNAIELDERFAVHVNVDSNSKTIRTDDELCVSYEMRTCELAEILDNTLGIGLVYEFRYVDKFLGYEKFRH